METVLLAPAVVQMKMVGRVVVVVLAMLTPAKTTVLADLVCNVMYKMDKLFVVGQKTLSIHLAVNVSSFTPNVMIFPNWAIMVTH